MHFKLRNKLHTIESIAGASIQIGDTSTGKVVLTTKADSHGVGSLSIASVPPGSYVCTIRAPQTSSDPVGPSLVSVGAVPNRVYRPVTLQLVRTAGSIGSVMATDPKHAHVTVSGGSIVVDIQPVWVKSLANSHRGQTISTIIVHHTACGTGPAVSTFLAEKGPHYMIDTDGQIVKWVQDSRAAWHAGVSRWEGHSDINARSIGIEIVHAAGTYPSAQYSALLDLLARIRAAYTSIAESSIVGHSDIGTNSGGILGRKSGDPGSHFEWSRLEARGLGLIPITGPPSLGIYGGIFQLGNSIALRRGDSDKQHRFGGNVHPIAVGTPIRELQEDLASIGYSAGNADGEFGDFFHHAVAAFQEHFFAGGRGHKSVDGKVDFLTAALITSVAQKLRIMAGSPRHAPVNGP